MKTKIKELEDAAVAPKAWTMVGEVSYRERPTNSLLAEDLLFDYAAKPAPVITQEYTVSLEDTIKKRISKVCVGFPLLKFTHLFIGRRNHGMT